ncbi:Mitochondrial ribosome-associated GTPase 1 [Anabarilius grahami]|uniref:Mitochondrial ribosome-associated GTPase 1 n=1 Tax=Anabarilius grahami TaxID=495550 RepID=A0A3N0YTI8_ANAGA|nr:Mitochondrial ribosome-associated GTPase 1 [Anabarilius grahami]
MNRLEREGVRNVLFTDCLRQRDENVKKIVPLVTELIESGSRFHREEVCDRPVIYLLDTPGVLPPKIENIETGMKLASCGTILDHLVGEDIIADYLLFSLNRLERFSYVEKYNLEEPCDDIQHVLKSIAVKLGKTKRVKAITGVGNITVQMPDYSAAAYDFIRAFRKGELGKVMLD